MKILLTGNDLTIEKVWAVAVEGAEVAGIDQAALQRRRRVAAFVAQLPELDAAQHLVDQARAPHIGFA